MLALDLRLGDFIPGLLLPPESNPPIIAGLLLLLAALYTLAIPTHPRSFAVVRVALGVPAGYFFYAYAFHEYDVSRRNAQTGLTVVGLYGIMRVIDACLIDLLVGVHTPPRWVVDGKIVPFPTTSSGRLAFALDYLLSLRGTSTFRNTTWDWIAPSTKRQMPSPTTSKSVFLGNALWSLFKQYLMYDALDALNKSRIWDNTLPHPITGDGLSIPEQLAFSFSLCACTCLSISMQFTLISSVAIICGAPIEAWPPMFDAPFSAMSLSDFWTRRWHAIFRRVFDRLSLGILGTLDRLHTPLPPHLRKPLRATVIFALSTTLHLLIIYRLPTSDTHIHAAFLDSSTMLFFLSQPLALFVERLVVVPLSGGNVWVTKFWAWSWLLYSGRWWADVWVRRGYWDQQEKVVGYSLVRGLWKGQWAV